MSALAEDLRRLCAAADDAGLSSVNSDFGKLTTRAARALATPATIDELQAIVRYASAQKIPLCLRGLAHSQNGQSLCDDAIIVSTRSLTRYQLTRDEAVAEAGVLWSTLVRDAAEFGATPRVLTMFTGLTVGGTLSVGGVGANSFNYGMQTEQVLALAVVTADGERHACTPGDALFDAVRGTLGTCGIIAEARIPLRAAAPTMSGLRFGYSDFVKLLADLDRTAESGVAQFVYGLIRPADVRNGELRGTLCVGIEGDAPADLAPGAQLTMPAVTFPLGSSHFFAASEPWPDKPVVSPWTDLIFAWDQAPALFERWRAHGLMDLLAAGDTALIRLPSGRGLMGCFPQVPSDKHAALLDVVRAIGRVCREEFGGGNYLSGYLPFPHEASWASHFGTRWPALQAAKRQFDPHGVLHPGLIF